MEATAADAIAASASAASAASAAAAASAPASVDPSADLTASADATAAASAAASTSAAPLAAPVVGTLTAPAAPAAIVASALPILLQTSDLLASLTVADYLSICGLGALPPDASVLLAECRRPAAPDAVPAASPTVTPGATPDAEAAAEAAAAPAPATSELPDMALANFLLGDGPQVSLPTEPKPHPPLPPAVLLASQVSAGLPSSPPNRRLDLPSPSAALEGAPAARPDPHPPREPWPTAARPSSARRPRQRALRLRRASPRRARHVARWCRRGCRGGQRRRGRLRGGRCPRRRDRRLVASLRLERRCRACVVLGGAQGHLRRRAASARIPWPWWFQGSCEGIPGDDRGRPPPNLESSPRAPLDSPNILTQLSLHLPSTPPWISPEPRLISPPPLRPSTPTCAVIAPPARPKQRRPRRVPPTCHPTSPRRRIQCWDSSRKPRRVLLYPLPWPAPSSLSLGLPLHLPLASPPPRPR